MNPLRIFDMYKPDRDPDQFKHFRTDPPYIKLAAWKQLQLRLAARDLMFCVLAGLTVLLTLAEVFAR